MSPSDIRSLRIKEILSDYKSGMTQADLARKYRTSTKTIRKWLTEAGLRRRRYQPYPDSYHDQAEKLYLDGYTVTEIARRLEVAPPNISRWLRSRGHQPGERYEESVAIRMRNPPPVDNKKHLCKKHWTPAEKQRVARMMLSGVEPRVIFWQTGASKKRQRMIARELGI